MPIDQGWMLNVFLDHICVVFFHGSRGLYKVHLSWLRGGLCDTLLGGTWSLSKEETLSVLDDVGVLRGCVVVLLSLQKLLVLLLLCL